jgi:hypothetical protein
MPNMGAMRITLFAHLAVGAAFLVSLGCRPAEDSLHNAAALERLGFQTLGNGFHVKPGIFLVQLDSVGRVSNIITPLGLRGFKYQESDGPYKAIALAPKSQSGERELRLFEENGDCAQFPVSGNGLISCNDPPPSTLFTPDETASRTPLKMQLAKIARLVAPNVYRIVDAGESHRDFYAIYGQERLIFAGNAQPGRLSLKTKIIGYHRRKDQWAEADFGALELEGEYIRYELASTGYIVSGSAQQIKEIPSDLTPDQRFTETESSGFHVGGMNSNDVIDRMTTLTAKPIEEIEWDGRPGGLSSEGFLGVGESFKERLKADNTFVRSRGFTHQQLAAPLFAVTNILDRIADRQFDDFTYGGHHYSASYESYRGFQESLFNDNLQTDRDFTVTNLGTGKKLSFSPLVPYYIARYGFYEGKTSYRVDPAAIIDTFQLRPR